MKFNVQQIKIENDINGKQQKATESYRKQQKADIILKFDVTWVEKYITIIIIQDAVNVLGAQNKKIVFLKA